MVNPQWFTIALPKADIKIAPEFLEAALADVVFRQCQEKIQWKQQYIQLFGKTIAQPRLCAWYGDPGTSYTYSGLRLDPLPWPAWLSKLKISIEQCTSCHFNSVLLNYYRDGSDSMGWHSDDEKELGEAPSIASLSLGEERSFHFKSKKLDPPQRSKLILGHGSLLLMKGSTQQYYLHQIPKSKKKLGARINLTFRYVQHD